MLAARTNGSPGVTGIDRRGVAWSGWPPGPDRHGGQSVWSRFWRGAVLVSAIAVEWSADRRVGDPQGWARGARIFVSAWLTEFAVAGGAAGIAAAVLGDLAAMVTIREVFHTEWHFLPGIMVMTIVISIVTMVMLELLELSGTRSPASRAASTRGEWLTAHTAI